MNDYILSIILGIVEGLTEFLPVSSTAHLRITQALLGVDLGDGFWKVFAVVIQLGAILCLPLYFWNRILGFFQTFPNGRRGDRTLFNHPISLTLIAFVSTAAPAFLLTKVIGKNLESLTIIGWSLLIGGGVMWVIDSVFGNRQPDNSETHVAEQLEKMSVGQAIFVGLCQVLAPLFPGVSRSMSTIASGQLAGLSRAAALEFSFLLSIPTMTAAVGYDLLKLVKGGHGEEALVSAPLTSHHWTLIAIGFVVSFIVAYAVVAWFMGWVRKRGFAPFAIYRIIAGICVLIWSASAR